LSFRSKIIGTAGAFALAACIVSPALAASGFDGLLGVDYSHFSANNGGGSANDYGGSATGMFNLGSHFGIQADGGYHHFDAGSGGGNSNNWDAGGTGFWTGRMGRIGVTGGYTSVSGNGNDIHATNYGAFGDWYATHAITFGVKGGGFSASGDSKGEYGGAALTGYITQNLSLQGGFDYTHIQHVGNEDDLSAKVEYLFSERVPVAIYAGYTNSKITGGGPTINVFLVGLTYFCDSAGPESLVVHQRTGAEEWGNSFGPTLLKF
jgi:hypothetical protein